jgi:hypothetical protein
MRSVLASLLFVVFCATASAQKVQYIVTCVKPGTTQAVKEVRQWEFFEVVVWVRTTPGKPHVAAAAAYDASACWTETPPSESIAGLVVTRMGLMIQLLRYGRLWIDAPYAQMRRVLTAIYTLAKEIEADAPAVALRQIEDMAVLYATAAPLGLSLDRRKIDEALKLTRSGIPPLGIVPPPRLVQEAARSCTRHRLASLPAP